jgi:hypothetical protein
LLTALAGGGSRGVIAHVSKVPQFLFSRSIWRHAQEMFVAKTIFIERSRALRNSAIGRRSHKRAVPLEQVGELATSSAIAA